MSDLISIPPEDASPGNSVVTAGPFWPDIDINDFRESFRVAGPEITHARLVLALRGALLSLRSETIEWKAAQVAAGYATLAAIPADEIDGESVNIHLYRRAIYAFAAADLLENHRDTTATGAGLGRIEESQPTAGDHKRNATHAIRDLKGKRRVKSALI
ncbi:head completion/stabilization protein [Asticcacaulis sp. BYS171W]|uniref:Head completion/stabilization protein n=1 Tax=Asticcacaulis aquaticus TaxID=2984212 RepID=A0ABT5HT80_9CAUL|nr:head completion/stabilization protein [Asticcacaulis aquaticus]MDC7683281.1 head completion/stabilization protein [Asticcacaulis aquaticus]